MSVFTFILTFAHNLNKESAMINFIRQATWIANLFRIKQNLKFLGFLVLLGTKYSGRHFSVTSKQINVNQALTSSQ
jgi:hypothetical protein